MNSLLLLILALCLFIIAYFTYGKWLAKKWGIDITRKTPSESLQDNIDYVPTDAKVVLGHHFSSIAGAGPITGPILASIFGLLPVYLWILFGSIFIGGIHDFSSLFASIRHDGKSIGQIMKVNVGKRGKFLFNLFSYAAIILVVAAFTDICAGTFQYLSSDAAKTIILYSSLLSLGNIYLVSVVTISSLLTETIYFDAFSIASHSIIPPVFFTIGDSNCVSYLNVNFTISEYSLSL